METGSSTSTGNDRCLLCRQLFKRKRKHQIYCSRRCRTQAWEQEHRAAHHGVLIMGGVRYRLVPERIWDQMTKEVMPHAPAATGQIVNSQREEVIRATLDENQKSE